MSSSPGFFLPEKLDLLLKDIETGVFELSKALGTGTLDGRGFEEGLRLHALDRFNLPFCILDEKGLFIDFNPAFLKLLSSSEEEIKERDFNYFFKPEDGKDFTFQSFFKREGGFYSEWSLLNNKGKSTELFLRAEAVNYKDKGFYLVLNLIRKEEILNRQNSYSSLAHIFEKLKEEIFILDAETLFFMDANAKALFNSDYSIEELRRTHIDDIFPGLKERVFDFLPDDKECKRIFGISVCRKDKSCYEAELRLHYVETAESNLLLAFVFDLTREIKILEALRESERNLSEAQQLAGMGSWKWEKEPGKTYWSLEMFKLMERDPEKGPPSFKEFLDSLVQEDREILRQALRRAWYQAEDIDLEFTLRIENKTKSMRLVGRALRDEEDRPLRLVGTIQDISEKKIIEAELKKLSMVIEQSINMVFITDIQGNITYANEMFEKRIGYTKEEIIGQNTRILSSGETNNQIYESLWETILSGKTWRGTFKNKTKSGSFYWVQGFISPVRGASGEIVNFLAIQEDITEKKEAEERALYLEVYDYKTGLLNRDSFIRRLEEKRYNEGAGLLFDIDGFKFVNDHVGYVKGDIILKELIEEIRRVLDIRLDREQYFMGRFAGDQIAVFLNAITSSEALSIAEEIRFDIERFSFGDTGVHLTLSGGIARIPDHAGEALSFLSVLDAALNKAKELGKNRCRVFSPDDRASDMKRGVFYQKQRILDALTEDRFEVWFQPILHLASRTIKHYEALVRLRTSSGKLVLPGAFIPFAERHGLIGPIDRLVVDKVFKYQRRLRDMGRNLSFSLNLSGRDLADPAMADFLKRAFEESGADPSSLIFEITETVAIQDMAKALEFIHQMKALGCRFSLDDFGVGFTSFVYLRELDVDFLKIDGSFVKNLHQKPEDGTVVRAIVQVAREMGIKTVAEFVEKEEILLCLEKNLVDYVQGFLIGRPAPEAMDISSSFLQGLARA